LLERVSGGERGEGGERRVLGYFVSFVKTKSDILGFCLIWFLSIWIS
jgi:hypothetical protein